MKRKRNKIFGTDGIRGRANFHPMSVELALALGRAAALIFRKHEGRHRVVIGKDTRLSCYMFENALIAGLCSMGVDTLMVGPLPTPGVAFITRAYRADAGIVISASHNPYYDNGIKLFSADGFKLSDELEQEIESIIEKNDFSSHLPPDAEIGKNTKIDDASGRYIEFIKSTVPRSLTLTDMKIGIDCANGSGYRVAPHVFKELGGQTHLIGCEPNGLNINDGCGALYPQNVRKLVLEKGLDVGISLDGDADRVQLVDEQGAILDGDVILAILAKHLKEKGVLLGGKVVTTVMSNFGFFETMNSLGIDVIQSDVGDRYVLKKLLEEKLVLGGEQSGHIIFLDKNTAGDGILTALQVLSVMKETGKPLSELASFVKCYPQVCINVPILSKPAFETMPKLNEHVKKVEKLLLGQGRVLLRYSGTENVCRVMLEGKDRLQVESLSKELAGAVESEIGAK